MSFKKIFVNGKQYSLATQIGKGGEGEVFTLAEDQSLAFKFYTVSSSEKAYRESKITKMLSLKLESQTQLVAFPVAVAKSNSGEFLGFVMRLLTGHKPLHDLYAPGSRKIHFAHADFRFLVRVASNIARAIASVHRTGCVIGDINHSSMLVSPKAIVALIDADSFQVPDSANKFLCKVGVPEYTPPELQGFNLSSVVRTPNHDAFGLAIVIFQILFMGRHPFVGTVRSGDIPPLHENIKNYRYVYTDKINVGMDQPPGTPSIFDFSPAIADAFDRAFLSKSNQNRPSAEQWVDLLQKLETNLVQCDENKLHFVPKDADICPWCEMENRLGTILFLPFIASGQLVENVFDPGAANFDLNALWKRVSAINLPLNIEPRLSFINPSPSQEAIKAKPGKFSLSAFNMPILGLAAGVGLVFLPALFIVWLPTMFWAFSKKDVTDNGSLNKFKNRYVEADKRFQQEIQNWYQRTGVKSFVDLRNELTAAKMSYEQASSEEQRLIQKYRNERREKQLFAYLDSFDISRAKIKGIGPSKEAVLASYGIDTAADINKSRLLSIPGFGEITSKPLLDWRASLERKFVYQPNENDLDKIEILKIKNATQSKLIALRKKLTAGSVNISIHAQKAQQSLASIDPVLDSINKMRLQAKSDLLYLGLPIPPSAQPIANPSVYSQQGISNQSASKMSGGSQSAINHSSSSSSNPTSSQTRVACPRCGSGMTKRLARKGRNAGSYFWGCTRYPNCKGTKNI